MSQNVSFTANQLVFIDWLAQSKFYRSPPTQELLADQLGVNRKTLTRWKQGNGNYTAQQFQDAVTARARQLLNEALPDIYGSLRDEATKGSFQHQRLALEMTGEYSPKQKVEQVNIELTELTDEQLERIANGEDLYTVATSGKSGTRIKT